MELVVVERSYPASVRIEDVAAQEEAVAWCLQQHRVTYKFTYFDRFRRHMVCYYEAPDAQAVRETQDTGGLAYDHIWTALAVDVPAAAPRPDGYELVIVQRQLERPIDLQRFAAPDDCLERNRATLMHSHISRKGDRMLCCFYAPDADSVRHANDQAQLPILRAWTATYICA